MSVISGEYFAPPQRPADFTHPKGQVWMPTETEPAQMRWQLATAEKNQGHKVAPVGLLSIERIAAAGMRDVFEHFDIRSFHTVKTDTEASHTPLEIHEAALTFPSSARLARLVDDYADASRRVERFRIKHCDGRYDGPDLLSALHSHQLLMSTKGEIEDPASDGSTYYFNYFTHDLTVHFPAWLCLPQDISQRIRRKATDTITTYNAAKNSPSSERFASAQKQVNTLGFLLDQTVNIWQMNDVVHGITDTYDANMSQILGIESTRYSETTREHISNPNEETVLAARPKGW